jgi:hypothetical protein
MSTDALVTEYAEKIKPILPLARKAYGSREQVTPAHAASREYTALLCEFVKNDGSLAKLAAEIGVTYSSVRRRVAMAELPATNAADVKKHTSPELVEAAVARVRNAKEHGVKSYHAQLATEYYENNVSLGAIAKGLGIKNAFPLYYGVNRHVLRTNENIAK